jgi:hypothetical protein
VARDKRTDETGRAKMVFAVITFGEGEKTALEETRSTVRYFNDLHSQM